jgi:hypothetical protein
MPSSLKQIEGAPTIACQIMFERFGRLTERGSCLRILILYLNIYIYLGSATAARRRGLFDSWGVSGASRLNVYCVCY